MMLKFEKIELLSAYLKRFNAIGSNILKDSIYELMEVIEFHSEEEWRLLDDQGKSDLLKASLSFNRKSGPDEIFFYAECLIGFFDELLVVFNKVNRLVDSFPDISKIDFEILRIYAVLAIEKGCFDETGPPRRHLTPIFFENLATQFSSKYPDLNLGLLAVLHKSMYDAWPEKPLHVENESK